MKAILFWQTLHRIMKSSKSNLKNPKYIPSVGCQLTTTFTLLIFYQTLKEKQPSVISILRAYGQENKDIWTKGKKNDLDLIIYKENWFDIVASFKKRTDILINEFQ